MSGRASVFVAGWRTALRMARREARRTKGRSVLVVAMIAVPVLGLAFGAVSYDMFHLRPTEVIDREMGAADADVAWPSDGPVTQGPTGHDWSGDTGTSSPKTTEQVLAALPAGTRAIPYTSGSATMRTTGGVATLDAVGVDVADPIARGLVTLLGGHAPASDTEVALTPQAAAHLGAAIGGTVRHARDAVVYTVVGLVEFPAQLQEVMVFRPTAVPRDAVGEPRRPHWLVTTAQPLDWDAVQRLNKRGIVVSSRAVLQNPPRHANHPAGTSELSLAGLVAGLAILEIVLLVGSAFAVGARRRRRELALVGATGGTPAHLRRIVLSDGVVLGALGAVAGIVLGVALALVLRPELEVHLEHSRAGGYRFFPLALAAIAMLALVVGWVAALVPAFTAARQELVTALAGRRGVTRSRRRWLVLGLALCVLGAAVTGAGAWRVSTKLLLAGLVTGELGLVLCTPALIGTISRLGRVLPLSFRIALRDTARNRASAAPAISAVMAAVAGSVALAVYLGAMHQRDVSAYHQSMPMGYASVRVITGSSGDQPPVASIADVLRRNLPARDVVTVDEPACSPSVPDADLCRIEPLLPPERRCPYQNRNDRPLTPDDRKAAAHDRRCDETEDGSAAFPALVDDGTKLGALTSASTTDLASATATLRAGGVVVTDARYVLDGKVTLTIRTMVKGNKTAPATTTVTLPGSAMTSGITSARWIISPAGLAGAGLAVAPAGVIAATTRMPTRGQEEHARAVLQGMSKALDLLVERGATSEWDPTLLILALAAGIITLGAAAIATGLAAADGRAELATLAAVGASPRVRRALSLSQSGVIAGLGSALGVVAGLGAALAVLVAVNQVHADLWPRPRPIPLVVPWLNLGVSLLAVPLIAMLGAGLLTRSRLPAERRRST